MIKIESGELKLSGFERLVFENKKIQLSDDVLLRTAASFNFLKSFSKGKIIYGVNTGFGPMAQHVVNSDNLTKLQFNLIRSHAGGLRFLEIKLFQMVC